ncbi:MAG: MvaI/BcnI restriction endonuclease family protein [Bacteroidales bacterium]|nr:MvaI/BcnI restriction endonuclease family protein [Bacteroidales bacterium]
MMHMRPYNAFENKNVKFLVDKQIEFATIQITETGLKKSILDATAPVRAYFKEKNVHDYDLQLQGPEHKRIIDTYIMTEDARFLTKTSLYRPLTKKGDPRLWVNKVRDVEFLRANDIFAIIAHKNIFFTVNLSIVDISKVCLSHIDTPLKDLIFELSREKNSVSDELLGLIKDRMTDWMPAEILADTGIGRTVESILGIEMNPSKAPDFKGIELKSHREASRVRNTLFTQTPDWSISRLKSGKAIVDEYGYIPDGYNHKSLHVTLSANKPNQQGLGLLVQTQLGLLEADEFSAIPLEDGTFRKINDVAVWKLIKLHERLLTKHRETFWIDAETKIESGCEFFRVSEILHTKNPIPTQFDVLLDQGQITVDFLLCRDSGGDTYSFKIKGKARPLLFPQSETYNLRAI